MISEKCSVFDWILIDIQVMNSEANDLSRFKDGSFQNDKNVVDGQVSADVRHFKDYRSQKLKYTRGS